MSLIKQKKKVLVVATVVRMHINVFHIPAMKWFKENGWETWVAAADDYDNPSDCVVPYCDHFVEIPFKRSPFKPGNINAYKQLEKLIIGEKFDLIYCHTPVGAMLARLAARKARKNGTKVIYMAHGFHFFQGASWKNWLFFYPVEKFLSRYTDVLITINQEDFKCAQKFHAKKVEYVPGVGINLSKFQSNPDKQAEMRNTLDIPQDYKVLLSVGEMSVRKNHKIILDAIAKMNDQKVLYMICGSGALKDELHQRAADLGISDQLRLMGFRKDVNEIYHSADVFVFPSLQEGLPVAVMEAMASGLPVIVSDVRGNRDLIDDGKGGYIVPKDDIGAFAEKISLLLNDPGLRQRMGTYNLEHIKDYSVDSVINKLSAIFIEAVK